MTEEFNVGSLVVLRTGSRRGQVGIVSQPVSEAQAGHVLTLDHSGLAGVAVGRPDIEAVDEDSHGFAQLAYQLIKLGSHVIEHRLIT